MQLTNIRKQFPNLYVKINAKPLVYLDSAATTLKPQCVIDSITNYYESSNANIHRGIHTLSQQSTENVESIRKQIKNFINAKNTNEIIFTSGTTSSLNMVAQCFGSFLNAGDEILISEMEHHSNIVPWQMLCKSKGCILKVIPFNDQGEIDVTTVEKYFNDKTKILGLVHASNTLGSINPVKEIIAIARKYNVTTIIDGAQSINHMPIDVVNLDCDFFAFSAHKIYGPTGIGILYGKKELLDKMPPYQGGGNMITHVTFDQPSFAQVPAKFEAGTPHIAGIIGLGAALAFIHKIGLNQIKTHDQKLLDYATKELKTIKGLKIIGAAKNKTPVISFTLEGIHPHDIGTILDGDGIAIRTGNHCTAPIMDHFNIRAASRLSCGIYNTKEDIDQTCVSINKAIKLFR